MGKLSKVRDAVRAYFGNEYSIDLSILRYSKSFWRAFPKSEVLFTWRIIITESGKKGYLDMYLQKKMLIELGISSLSDMFIDDIRDALRFRKK